MRSIKEITVALKDAEEWQEWMSGIAEDERVGVQKAWFSWQKKQEKRRQLLQEHQAKVAFDLSYGGIDALIAGVDEAGRGPLAGPVVTAAVILPTNSEALVGLNDSKQLSKDKRNAFAALIKEHAISYFIHFQPAQQIDELNIYEATKQSMKASVESLSRKPDYVLVDAMTLSMAIPQDSIIKGDAKSLAIAAASILAKTARDDYMEQLDKDFPMYGFAQHAGYGTKQHLKALEEYGPTIHHRKSFEPIKSMFE
ncbi:MULTISPECIES: ribonuclease HII [Lysinibacillus]|uniref:ribonuclease HII n=1 Tax=Lysinibacillus TaxID=400634 RepID=UPI0012472673|nr:MULTISPECIES: ribonuclease HII [Lysinibacillus]KAB0441868.1 ribonuclease HII [Lysinibacillus fusiformis]MCT6815818.1 ribonuclease HII [Lysinibacillus fusiformis]MCT6928579.1 ribonuclease HII [Lysinibacillus fusiformis]MCT6933312.1 ribonuclease HII [Lysinibacillus fusiformis]UXJ69878.1 ribonuclease HII [Lysinibacillus fusiformis]